MTTSAAPAESALAVHDLVKVYPGRDQQPPIRAVDGMSFQVRRGEIFGLLGPNGAGKTTILKILTTLLAPTSGRADVLGYDVVTQPLEVRRRIAVVLQESAIEMFLSVRDNLVTFGKFHGLSLEAARRQAEVVASKFQLREHLNQKAQDLSGGFRRRVQVAKMFMVDSPVMFLDEFSTGMDPILKRAVMGYLREEAARGRTIVLTTQVLSEAEELCDDILIMHKGRTIAQGDLYTLKLLSKDLYDVVLTFDALPTSLPGELAHLEPHKLSIDQNTVEMTLKANEERVLEIVGELARKGRLLRVEVSGASLEDIFVELTRES
ncbi:MAG: ABC transporter ATP-binding protein [Acidobacteria bacterium]|nr:ABC transporter ATP-binding protein [Acidobacteriota bacterium]